MTITALRYIVNVRFQISGSHNVVDMNVIINIEVKWVGATFRTRPKWLTCIKENMKSVEMLKSVESCFCNSLEKYLVEKVPAAKIKNYSKLIQGNSSQND